MTRESPDGLTTVQPSASVLTDSSTRPSSVSHIVGRTSGAPEMAAALPERRRDHLRNSETRREGCTGSEPERGSVIDALRIQGVWAFCPGPKSADLVRSYPQAMQSGRRL